MVASRLNRGEKACVWHGDLPSIGQDSAGLYEERVGQKQFHWDGVPFDGRAALADVARPTAPRTTEALSLNSVVNSRAEGVVRSCDLGMGRGSALDGLTGPKGRRPRHCSRSCRWLPFGPGEPR